MYKKLMSISSTNLKALICVSWQSNQEQVLLHGEDRLYLTCGDSTQAQGIPEPQLHQENSPHHRPPTLSASSPHLAQGLSTLLGHKHWHVVQVSPFTSVGWSVWDCTARCLC